MEPEIDSSSCSGSLQEPWPAGGGRTPAVCDVVVGVAEPYAPRQFDRSSSFTGLTHSSIEMAGAGADCGSSSSSDDALPDAPPGPVQHCHPGTSMADAAAGAEQGSGGSSSGWAVFEVDEPSTETTFIMRGLREALAKKTDECEHLRQIIKELSESRARAHKGKVALEESHAALQKEYMRVIKVSEIARSASQQSLSRSHEMRKELQTARDAASRAARRGAAAADKARRLKAQNAELRQRVGALEDLAARVGALEAAGTSASMRAFLDTARVGLY